ncbi:hypothetical protein V1478_001314 [Vespula squamosa]|uniref:Uncharacterized protein n=1 Tax=Vespula squamosa TaxID=30214 RepID=A0ABD2C133_VESSQ
MLISLITQFERWMLFGNALKKQRLGHEAKKRLYAEEAPTILWLKRATIDDESFFQRILICSFDNGS